MHKIGILSDTHSLLREEVKEVLMTCDVILHMGDIASKECYEQIDKLTDAYFVRGNADKEWAEDIPWEQEIDLFGYHVYMVHNKKHIRQDLQGIDIVLYGHSHKYEQVMKEDIVFFNPGSCGPRRFHQPITMAIMIVDEEKHSFTIEKYDLSPTYEPDKMKLPPKDMDKLLRSIMKDMDHGKSIEHMAKKNRVSVEVVNQILQIYTTHPGIDVDGILNRMDIFR